MCGVLPQQDIKAIAVRAEDGREGKQPWPRAPNVRSAQNLWLDLSVAQILATVADCDSFGDAGCIARDLARSASRPIRMSSGSIQCLKTGSFTPIDSREDSGPTPVPPDFRKLAGYGALAALVAGLRAHDAQLDRSNGKLDTAR